MLVSLVASVVLLDHINVTLSIRSSQTGVDFLDTSLTFYDCTAHRSYVVAVLTLTINPYKSRALYIVISTI